MTKCCLRRLRLLGRFDRIAYTTTGELAELAIANLDQLQFVGVVERLGDDLPRLFRRLDMRGRPAITRQNGGRPRRRIDVREPGIRRVLEQFVVADMRLYRHVVRRRGLIGHIRDRFRAAGTSGRVR